MQRNTTPTLMQVGIYLIVAALLIIVAANVGAILLPIANLMLIVGVILAIIAAVSPGRR